MSFNTFGKYLDLLPGKVPRASNWLVIMVVPQISLYLKKIFKDMIDEDLGSLNLPQRKADKVNILSECLKERQLEHQFQ